MKKIVVLSGSMRKNGNTELLANAFAEGAGENNSVEVLSVADYKVNPCIGCNACYRREDKSCFQKDDMKQIYERLKEADILVLASPVYFYGISAQLKAIVDRMHSPIRNEFSIKKLGLLLVGADTMPKLFDSIIMQYQMVLDYFHLDSIGMVLADGAEEKGAIRSTDFLAQAYQLGLSVK